MADVLFESKILTSEITTSNNNINDQNCDFIINDCGDDNDNFIENEIKTYVLDGSKFVFKKKFENEQLFVTRMKDYSIISNFDLKHSIDLVPIEIKSMLEKNWFFHMHVQPIRLYERHMEMSVRDGKILAYVHDSSLSLHGNDVVFVGFLPTDDRHCEHFQKDCFQISTKNEKNNSQTDTDNNECQTSIIKIHRKWPRSLYVLLRATTNVICHSKNDTNNTNNSVKTTNANDHNHKTIKSSFSNSENSSQTTNVRTRCVPIKILNRNLKCSDTCLCQIDWAQTYVIMGGYNVNDDNRNDNHKTNDNAYRNNETLRRQRINATAACPEKNESTQIVIPMRRRACHICDNCFRCQQTHRYCRSHKVCQHRAHTYRNNNDDNQIIQNAEHDGATNVDGDGLKNFMPTYSTKSFNTEHNHHSGQPFVSSKKFSNDDNDNLKLRFDTQLVKMKRNQTIK